MAVEAPLSKFKKNGFKLYIGVCLIVAVVLAYDGYLSKYEWSKRHKFYKEHVLDNNGKPDSTMLFNMYVPFGLIVAAAALGVRFVMVKDEKLTTDDTKLTINGGKSILYDKIESIDKTHFDAKGYFVITHVAEGGKETDLKLSDRMYDNLAAVLDELIAKIS
jgi:hypothetical protein